MTALSITLILMMTAYLSSYDYSTFLKTNKTGRLSLIVRIVLFPVFVLMVFKDVQDWTIAIGFSFFIQWWIWDMFTGLFWYKNPFATGNTKFIDKLLNKIPAQFLWFAKWFLAVCFYVYHLNGL